MTAATFREVQTSGDRRRRLQPLPERVEHLRRQDPRLRPVAPPADRRATPTGRTSCSRQRSSTQRGAPDPSADAVARRRCVPTPEAGSPGRVPALSVAAAPLPRQPACSSATLGYGPHGLTSMPAREVDRVHPAGSSARRPAAQPRRRRHRRLSRTLIASRLARRALPDPLDRARQGLWGVKVASDSVVAGPTSALPPLPACQPSSATATAWAPGIHGAPVTRDPSFAPAPSAKGMTSPTAALPGARQAIAEDRAVVLHRSEDDGAVSQSAGRPRTPAAASRAVQPIRCERARLPDHAVRRDARLRTFFGPARPGARPRAA